MPLIGGTELGDELSREPWGDEVWHAEQGGEEAAPLQVGQVRNDGEGNPFIFAEDALDENDDGSMRVPPLPPESDDEGGDLENDE